MYSRLCNRMGINSEVTRGKNEIKKNNCKIYMWNHCDGFSYIDNEHK